MNCKYIQQIVFKGRKTTVINQLCSFMTAVQGIVDKIMELSTNPS